MLAPFDKVTRQISSADASLADVILVVTALLVTLERNTDNAGVQTMMCTMLDDMRRRFSGMMEEPLFVDTSVNPRYRICLFEADQKKKATSLPTEAVHRQQSVNDDVCSPGAKRQRLDQSTADGVEDVLDELLALPTETQTLTTQRQCGRRTSLSVPDAGQHPTSGVGDVVVERKRYTVSRCGGHGSTLPKRPHNVSTERTLLQRSGIALQRPPQPFVARKS